MRGQPSVSAAAARSHVAIAMVTLAGLNSTLPSLSLSPLHKEAMPRPSLHVSLWRTCIIHDLITTSWGDGRRSTLRLMGVWRIMACHRCDFLTMREKELRAGSYQAFMSLITKGEGREF